MIVATQMMESMVFNSRPTRAEITDAGQAALDRNDCVMLSGETAGGSFPIESVETLSRILSYTESNIEYEKNFLSYSPSKEEQQAYDIVKKSFEEKADFIVNLDDCPTLTKQISQFRPRAIILHATKTPEQFRYLSVYFGVWVVERDEGELIPQYME